MCNMKIQKNTPIVIYGAGQRGYYYKEKLESQGLANIIAFLDRNAETLMPRDETKISTLSDFEVSGMELQKILIVITVSNRFKHKEIAEQLYKSGFRFILFQQQEIHTENQKKIDFIFTNLFSVVGENKLLEQEVPTYELLKDIDERGSIIVAEEEHFIVSFVPVEILFGVTRELLEKVIEYDELLIETVPDKSILYFNISYELLESFQHGVDLDFNDKYMKIYISNRNNLRRTDRTDISDIKMHLKDRYEIYQNMDKKFCINHDFFLQNPPDVKWNTKGYFNIEDGNNRAAFMLSKNMFLIPCKMDKMDYERWVNKKTFDKIVKFMELYNISNVELPIAHPEFTNIIASEEFFSRKKLFAVGRWLGKRGYSLNSSKVLDIGCKTGFFGRFCFKMGARVTALEKNLVCLEFCNLINELLYTTEIELLPMGFEELEEGQLYHISFVERELLKEYDVELLEKLGRMTKDILIADILLQSDLQETIIACTGFNRCHILCNLPLNGEIYKLCLFTK